MESFCAGGSDYYVVVRDDMPTGDDRNQRVILRETPTFPNRDNFKPFSAKRVKMIGRWAGTIKYDLDPFDQTPVSPDSNGQIAFGGGLLVDQVTVLER
jgi:hypothetical protein